MSGNAIVHPQTYPNSRLGRFYTEVEHMKPINIPAPE